MEIKRINELRKVMGTLPTQNVAKKYRIEKGVENISVELVDYNVNPYKSMYILGTSCWGSKVNKWKGTMPEHRFAVVKAILDGKALPLALECPIFTFVIEGPSRAAFDQFARTRIGAVFSAKGMRDNNWKDCSIRVPNALYRKLKPVEIEMLKEHFMDTKDVYSFIVDIGRGSWQAARTVLPLYVCYGWSATYNFMSLRGVCANRMKFCEMEDTVATAWLMAREVSNKFPLLGSYLRPGCDFINQCQYHKQYELSELFGCLFSVCGRNKCLADNNYAEFNETCTDFRDLEKQLGIKVIRSNEWPEFTWESLSQKDKDLFMED